MNLPDAPIAEQGFFVTHFLTVADQSRSKEFYVKLLCGMVVREPDPTYVKLANSWIILNSGGGPTPDKPEVILETPRDLNRVSSFLNLRVADIWDCYNRWRAKGACSSQSRSTMTAMNSAVICAIRTVTLSRLGSIARRRLILSRKYLAENEMPMS